MPHKHLACVARSELGFYIHGGVESERPSPSALARRALFMLPPTHSPCLCARANATPTGGRSSGIVYATSSSFFNQLKHFRTIAAALQHACRNFLVGAQLAAVPKSHIAKGCSCGIIA